MKPLALVLLVAISGCVTEYEGTRRPEADPATALERRVGLARQYIGSGDWENAKRNLDLAQALDDNSAIVFEAFGLFYQSTGEFDKAETSFKRALRADSSFSRARNNYAAFLYAQGRYKEAAREFSRVTDDSLYSGRPLAFINLGSSLLQLNDRVGARQAFERALSMDRRNPYALLEMAELTLDAGDVDSASRYYGVYKTVIARQPPRGLLLGFRIAREMGDLDAASSYELALRNLYPESAEYRSLSSGF